MGKIGCVLSYPSSGLHHWFEFKMRTFPHVPFLPPNKIMPTQHLGILFLFSSPLKGADICGPPHHSDVRQGRRERALRS